MFASLLASPFGQRFFVTTETVADGQGFATWTLPHTAWLIATVALIVIAGLWYRRATPRARAIFRYVFAALLVADELFKIANLLIMGQYLPKYLPLHLCSINIFIICIYAFRQTETLKNFLYLCCFTGAAAALLFPSWDNLPTTSFMYWHSTTVHMLLCAFPLILVVGGETRPNIRYVPRVFGILLIFVAVALVANLIFDTNFMFLMSGDAGNPLGWFETHWGSHLWGFPVIIGALLVVLYVPWIVANKRQKEKPVKAEQAEQASQAKRTGQAEQVERV